MENPLTFPVFSPSSIRERKDIVAFRMEIQRIELGVLQWWMPVEGMYGIGVIGAIVHKIVPNQVLRKFHE